MSLVPGTQGLLPQLFTIESDRLKEVDIDATGPLEFSRLSADDHELWSCGNERVLRFDGNEWKQYIYPYPENM